MGNKDKTTIHAKNAFSCAFVPGPLTPPSDERSTLDDFSPQTALSLLFDEEIIEELKKRGYKVLKQTTKWEEV